MSLAPSISSRRFTSIGLSTLYSLATTLPTALALWMAQGTAIALPAAAQGAPPPRSTEAPQMAQSSAEQDIQDARQNLLSPDNINNPASPTSPYPSIRQPDVYSNPSPIDPNFDRYRLGPGDSIYINVIRFPDLSFQGTLDLEGNVLIPLVGLRRLQGLTLDETRDLVQTELNRYVVNPQAEVVLTAQRSVQVTILGEVVKPGLYPLGAPQLAVALAQAGGATRLADLRAIRIRRYLDDGTILEQNVDLYTPLQRSNSIADVRLADGDTIIIPTLTANNSHDYDRDLVALSTLSQASITIRVLNYAGGNGTTAGRSTLSALELPGGSSFVDAVTATGINPRRNIALLRFDPELGQVVTQRFNARDAVRGDYGQNPPLEDNDVIIVGRNLFDRISGLLNSFTLPFRDVLGFILFFERLTNSAEDLFGPSGDNNND
ncbi:MAG TPA: polysaccharide biosynthesis/export family protein [Chroococcidiopsis sp.]